MCSVGYLVQNHEGEKHIYILAGVCTVYPVHSAYSIDNIRILEYANCEESIRLVGEDKYSLGGRIITGRGHCISQAEGSRPSLNNAASFVIPPPSPPHPYVTYSFVNILSVHVRGLVHSCPFRP